MIMHLRTIKELAERERHILYDIDAYFNYFMANLRRLAKTIKTEPYSISTGLRLTFRVREYYITRYAKKLCYT